ncbi:hypothetical protein, partial [Pseudomonas gregormendelii]|uniref:hypothetical protein n=1 Tax=Pseudomonas gregormendelii TaxID=1628277 RepID=UPI001980CC9C
AEALDMTDLNGGAFFDAEFVIGHGAAPYRKGQVLHSVFAAAGLSRRLYPPYVPTPATCFPTFMVTSYDWSAKASQGIYVLTAPPAQSAPYGPPRPGMIHARRNLAWLTGLHARFVQVVGSSLSDNPGALPLAAT